MTKVTPMKAIRLKCLQCTCGQFQEVRECTIKDCALYPYRMGRRPKKEECTVKANDEIEIKEENPTGAHQ